MVVIGAGNAAFTAAPAARRAGCAVTVLEKASEPIRGGNTRFTGGVFRLTYEGLDDLVPIVKNADDASDVVVDPYPAEAFERDLQRMAGGRTDPLLSRVLIERSYDTVRWIATDPTISRSPYVLIRTNWARIEPLGSGWPRAEAKQHGSQSCNLLDPYQ